MLTNYFKIALRTLRKHTGYTFINIFGLAVGLAACLLIGLYVQDELSYDDFHAHADRTYRVLREFDIPDLHGTIPTTPPALAPALKEGVPAIEAAVRIYQFGGPVVERGAQKFVESSFIYAEAGFFEMFSFPVLRGEAALDRPHTIVLTEAMVVKYFPDENPVGQTLQVGNDELEVTGVIAEVPTNSHLQFDFIASLSIPEPNWGQNNYTTYVRLGEGQSKEALIPQIADLIQLNSDPQNEREGNDFMPHLQPITGIHLGQGVAADIGSQGNIQYVYLFIALAAFIVLLACINFMNLATARSAIRAREVGMRKTLGARRGQLAAQFLGESVLMTGLALLLALVLCQLTLPLLNNLADKSLAFSTLYSGPQVLILVGLALLVGLVAGAYPAFVLSGFQPSRVLKGAARPGGDRLRKGLVVFQFAISIALLVGTGVVQHQLRFMKSTGLGFNAENVVLIEQANFLGSQTETFRQQVGALPGVEQVASGFSMPGTFFINSMWQPVVAEGAAEAEAQNMDYSFVDFNYAETLGLEMIAGRSFSPDFATDSMAVILNEAAVRDFGWSPEEAIGQQLTQGRGAHTIIGVAKDFHYRSLHAEIYPLALFGPRRAPRYVAARIAPDDVPGTLATLQSTWKQFSDLPFEYAFLADDLETQYRAEDRLAKVFGVFAGLAILIGCLGLFGLAAFMAAQRTKEIGIRKVLGASVGSLIALLSKDFLKLVVVAFVIAAPLAYFAMNWWLEDFAYRVGINPWTFIGAGLLALFIALATVSYQAIRTAVANPVDSLRYE